MSATFQSILLTKLKKTHGDKTVGKLSTDLEQKALDLKGTLQVRMEREVAASEIEAQAEAAASERVDDILSDMISSSVLDARFFTDTSKIVAKGKVEVPETVYGLRDKRGRLMSGLGLTRAINLVLYKFVMQLMGAPRLVNRTGRFAHSAHLNKVLFEQKQNRQRKNRVSLYFSYMTYPYQVFEKDRLRDPRPLIRNAVMEALKEVLSPTSFKANIFNIGSN